MTYADDETKRWRTLYQLNKGEDRHKLARAIFQGKQGELRQRYREGYPVKDEDVARLSPLVFEHINVLGRYAFSVPEAVTRGELRRLRNPANALEEVA